MLIVGMRSGFVLFFVNRSRERREKGIAWSLKAIPGSKQGETAVAGGGWARDFCAGLKGELESGG